MVTKGLTKIDLSGREALPQEIARNLLDYVFASDMAPGTRMPSERQLAQSLGVGRSSVREALKSLGLLGLVEVRQGDGTYLKRPDSELLPKVIEWGLLLGERRTLDLVDARQQIEVVVARLAAERRTTAQVQAMKKVLQRMGRSGKVETFVESDVAFHLSVAEAAQNTVLLGVLDGVQSLLRVWIRRVVAEAGETRSSYEEHVPVFSAIERGDPEAAGAAMTAHMAAASARLRATLADHEERAR